MACVLGVLLLASGCFFSPLPLPDDPAPERPNLNLSRAVPPVSQVLNVMRDSSPVSFTVPFTSVDGDEAQAAKALEDKGVEFVSAPHRIHRHQDGTEEWMAFFNDLEDRPLALMARARPG